MGAAVGVAVNVPVFVKANRRSWGEDRPFTCVVGGKLPLS
jgi:hypothetical protein